MDRQPLTDRLGDKLLAEYGGAAAAYSLRSLSGDQTKVVRVRRSSDNAEKDFTASEMGAALEDWVGALNDGYVETWYDQSGNGNDATQTVAASQPKIVDAGTYLGEIDFDGSDDHLDFTGIATTDVSVFSVVDLDVTSSQERILSAQSGFAQGFAINNATTGFFRGGGGTASTPALNTTFSANTPTLYSLIRASGTGTFSTNNTASASFTNTDVFTPASIAGVVSPMDGSAKEIILYDSDQSSNRTAIEANINNEYSIY